MAETPDREKLVACSARRHPKKLHASGGAPKWSVASGASARLKPNRPEAEMHVDSRSDTSVDDRLKDLDERRARFLAAQASLAETGDEDAFYAALQGFAKAHQETILAVCFD
jgi:hypothetical protein